jgi:pyruvate formate lyase activating enzyme
LAAGQKEDVAVLFDVQRFSLHDGPGIRTTLFFKGCPLRCGWCQNPESLRPEPEIAFYAERCRESYACIALCPQGALAKGSAPRVDFSRCDGCGRCVAGCSFGALRLIGRRWRPEDLLEECLKDADYFADSGGGVTLSGGEPMLHAAFLRVLLPALRQRGVHTALQTCGAFAVEDLRGLLPSLDLIHLDLKLMDPELHRRYTGAGNRGILRNFTELAREFPALQARMPVLPGINDDPQNVAATADFLRHNGKRSIHLLPYHSLGTAKLIRIAPALQPLKLTVPTSEIMQSVRGAFEHHGIEAICYD